MSAVLAMIAPRVTRPSAYRRALLVCMSAVRVSGDVTWHPRHWIVASLVAGLKVIVWVDVAGVVLAVLAASVRFHVVTSPRAARSSASWRMSRIS
jgi:hypothetical protein